MGCEILGYMIPGAIKPYGENFSYKDYEINQNLSTALETITKENDRLSQTCVNSKKAMKP